MKASVNVKELAEWLVLTPTRVQQLAKKGIVVKDAHGVYRLKESVQAYIREMNVKADGKNSDWHKARTRKEKARADAAELDNLERMKNLVSADGIRREIEKAKAEERQAILNMPKNVAPRLEGLSLVEMEVELAKWASNHLASAASLEFSSASSAVKTEP